MSQFFHAVDVFFEHLAAVHWGALALAIAFHVMKAVVRTFAWRNIIRAAFPGGDAVKLYIARHGIEGSNYATLASTLAVETLFDFFVASLLFLWALQQGVLPSLSVLPKLPNADRYAD